MAKKENRMDLYYVDKKYIRDLANVDSNVLSVSPQNEKETRPFLGIVVVMDDKEYCIPLTSPKEKFNTKTKEDFIKIPDPKIKNPDGGPKTIGILNLNNMIPVSKEFIKKIDLSDNAKMDNTRKTLLLKEIKWCRNNKNIIQKKTENLYQKVILTPDKDKNLTKRCCKFQKLEFVLDKKIGKQNESFNRRLENEKENNRIVKVIKDNGLKPNYLLISTYKEINSYYKKDMSIESICQLYKTPDLVPNEIESEIKAFGDECAAQQNGKDDPE